MPVVVLDQHVVGAAFEALAVPDVANLAVLQRKAVARRLDSVFVAAVQPVDDDVVIGLVLAADRQHPVGGAAAGAVLFRAVLDEDPSNRDVCRGTDEVPKTWPTRSGGSEKELAWCGRQGLTRVDAGPDANGVARPCSRVRRLEVRACLTVDVCARRRRASTGAAVRVDPKVGAAGPVEQTRASRRRAVAPPWEASPPSRRARRDRGHGLWPVGRVPRTIDCFERERVMRATSETPETCNAAPRSSPRARCSYRGDSRPPRHRRWRPATGVPPWCGTCLQRSSLAAPRAAACRAAGATELTAGLEDTTRSPPKQPASIVSTVRRAGVTMGRRRGRGAGIYRLCRAAGSTLAQVERKRLMRPERDAAGPSRSRRATALQDARRGVLRRCRRR